MGLRRPSFAITLAALVLCLPLLVVITSPLHAAAPEWSHVWRTILPGHLIETIALLAGTLIIALLLGVSTAWLVASFQFPLRGVLRWALVLPLACPTYISAFTYAALLGPTGSLSVWLHEHAGIRPDIMNLPGLCVVMAVVLYPYVHLPARAAFAAGMSQQLDAARTLGAHNAHRFFRIALPLARPAIVGGAVLVAMETLNDYGAVKYFGIRTLTTGIFRSWSGLYDAGSALRLGAVLAAADRPAPLDRTARAPRCPAGRGSGAVLPKPLGRWQRVDGDVLVHAGPRRRRAHPLHQTGDGCTGHWPTTRMPELIMAMLRTLGIANLTAITTLATGLLFLYARRHGTGPRVDDPRGPPWLCHPGRV
jgi:iron(III) transport system permease protein